MSKTPSPELFKLIKSLTKTEKRYFKVWIHSQLKVNLKIYYTLFDSIDRQKKYDEGAIITEVGVEKKLFPKYKERLFEIILKSLRNYSESSSEKAKLQAMLYNAELLYSKTLYQSCEKIIYKVKKNAKKHELFLILIDALKLESKVLLRQIGNKSDANQNKIILREQLKSIESEKNFLIYNNLYQELVQTIVVKSSKNEDIESLEDIIQSPFLMNSEDAITFYSKVHFYNTHRLRHYYFGERQESYTNSNAVINLFESKEYAIQLKDNQLDYSKALHSFMIDCAMLSKEVEFGETLIKLNLVFKKFPSIKKFNFPLIYIANLLMIEHSGNIKKITEVAKDFEVELNNFKGDVPIERVIIVYFNIACLYTLNGDYKKALPWVNKVLNNIPFKGFREDICACTRILNLIIHYEIHNFKLVGSLTQSYYAILIKQKKSFKTEKIILEFIKENPKLNFDEENLAKKLKQLHIQLEKMIESENVLFNSFNFLYWIETKIK